MAKKITEDGEIVDVVTHEAIARTPPFFKTPFNHDTDVEALATSLTCRDASKTQQQFAKDAEINAILAKFMNTGGLPVTGTPNYTDVEEEFDLQNSMITAHQVQEAWNQLPQAARDLLGDPERFTRYVERALETGDRQALERVDLVKPKAPEPAPPPGGTPDPEAGKAPPGGVNTPPQGAKPGA